MAGSNTGLDWQRVEQLFFEALERPEADRESFLHGACDGDDALCNAVLRLLRADAGEAGQLDTAYESGTLEAAPASLAADVLVGPWRIISELGRGGMGIVYRAERADGTYEQQVAVKIVRGGLLAGLMEPRFLRERRILASLQHPNIARMLDAGATADGLPYFVMELVEGEPVTNWCEGRNLPLDHRLDIMLQICDALAHAHQNLVVHRDLKPANVLVSAAGDVRLVDFGVAHLLDERGALTRESALPLTPEYAAPEQFSNGPITTGTDVFAAGAILYELLSGARPREVGTGSPAELVTAMNALIVPPSQALAAAGRPRFSPDLDAIVMRAMASEPSRRYGSIGALAADIRRYLSAEPVTARPDTLLYRAGKFVRRHRFGVAAACALAIVVIAGAGATAWQAAAAAAEARKSEAVTAFVLSLFAGVDPAEALGDELTARHLVDAGAERIQSELQDEPLVRAEILTFLADMYDKLDDDDRGLELVDMALAELGNSATAELGRALLVKGRILIGRSEDESGVALLERALPILARHEQQLDMAEAHDLVVITLTRQGAHDAALQLTEKALDLRVAAVGTDHPTVADSYNNLGVLARNLGRLGAARKYHAQALDIRRRILDPDHPLIAISLNNLGAVVYAEGDFESAASYFADSLAMNRRVNGSLHHDTIASLNNFGLMQLRLGRIAAAREAFAEVLDYWVAQDKAEHPNALVTRINIGTAARMEGELEASLNEYRLIEPLVLTQLGAEHPVTAALLHHQARALIELGRISEARALVDRALAIRIGVFGETHPDNAELLRDQALLSGMGTDLEVAATIATQALGLQEARLPAAHPSIAITRVVLGTIERSLGRTASALDMHRQAHELLENQLGATHPETLNAGFEFGRSLLAAGDPRGAKTLLETLRPAFMDRVGEVSWQAGEFDLAIAIAGEQLGEQNAGQRESAVARIVESLPGDHPRRISLLSAESHDR